VILGNSQLAIDGVGGIPPTGLEECLQGAGIERRRLQVVLEEPDVGGRAEGIPAVMDVARVAEGALRERRDGRWKSQQTRQEPAGGHVVVHLAQLAMARREEEDPPTGVVQRQGQDRVLVRELEQAALVGGQRRQHGAPVATGPAQFVVEIVEAGRRRRRHRRRRTSSIVYGFL
jgi:hypothetical protein